MIARVSCVVINVQFFSDMVLVMLYNLMLESSGGFLLCYFFLFCHQGEYWEFEFIHFSYDFSAFL